MKVSEIGEFNLIDRIKSIIGRHGDDVRIGIGDDAALVSYDGIEVLLTTDVLVENVHFTNEIPPHSIGYKSIAVNISDIAAMGGKPKHILVSLSLPENTEIDFVDEMYKGMIDCAKKYNAGIVGGNMSRSSEIVINVTVTGTVEPENLRKRSTASVGDSILVTGSLGGSAAGLLAIEKGIVDQGGYHNNDLIKKHLYPKARIEESRFLAKLGSRAVEDISDSLFLDLSNICLASNVGAVIDVSKIPVALEAKEIKKAIDCNPLNLALSGGEDYELLLTASKEQAKNMIESLMIETGTELSEIGEIVEGSGVRLIDPDGEEFDYEKSGFDHFKGAK